MSVPVKCPDPAIRLGEEADRHEAGLIAHVEPVRGAIRHRDQVVLHTLDLVDLVVHVQREQPRPGHEEADLIFLVEVLVQELLAQFGAVGVVRRDRGHVHALEAVLGHQPVDVAAVGGEHLVLARTRRHLMGRLPAFEGHPDLLQLGGNQRAVLGIQQRGIGNIVIVNAQSAHGGSLNGEGDLKEYQRPALNGGAT